MHGGVIKIRRRPLYFQFSIQTIKQKYTIIKITFFYIIIVHISRILANQELIKRDKNTPKLHLLNEKIMN